MSNVAPVFDFLDFHVLRLSKLEINQDFWSKIQTRIFNTTGWLIETRE
jgi:hypothetical protein